MRFILNENDSGHFQVLVTGDGPKGEGLDDFIVGAPKAVTTGKKYPEWFEDYIVSKIEKVHTLSNEEREALYSLKP